MRTAHDLSLIYAGWPAEDVLWIPRAGQGGVRRAIFNGPGTLILGGEIISSDTTLQYPTASFPGVRRDDRFVINGQEWKAREDAQKSMDGDESTVPLELCA